MCRPAEHLFMCKCTSRLRSPCNLMEGSFGRVVTRSYVKYDVTLVRPACRAISLFLSLRWIFRPNAPTPRGKTARGGEGVIGVVEELCYKPEGRCFDSRLRHRMLSIYLILPIGQGAGIYLDSNRNEMQGHKHKMFLESRARPVSEPDNLAAMCVPIV
jgi:hypothetical protein